jgi:hypothetical protein
LIIVYSSISCALACGGNETCETLRCWPVSQCEAGLVPADNEDVSPNKVNLFRPRYTNIPTANLPKVVKPVIDMEEINTRTCQVGRGDWRERTSKEQLQYLGEPFHNGKPEVGGTYGRRENHNPFSLWQGKSERRIRTAKRGNACGVKVLCRYHVYRTKRRTA